MNSILTLSSGIILPLFLCFAGLFFFLYLNGAPFVGLFSSLKSLKSSKRNGQSPLKAVILALAGTLGVGNMVGVAAAIKEGGAGVLFWMWISSFLAMVVKFAEIKLSILHRGVDEQGRACGGAMYYMPPPFDKVFSFLCILCAFSVGCAMQASAFASSFSQLVPMHKAVLILPLLLLMIPVFLKGKSKIFDLAAILVPAMSLLYIAICMCVLFRYKSALPGVFERIFKEAFRFKSIALGAGSGMLTALRLGVVRGILSNEAGCGTAPLAHAATTSESGNAQGSLGVIEVAFDTLLLCSLTGLSLLVYPPALEEHGGMAMLFAVFSSVIGKSALLLLPLSILLFAFATLLCWCYYGRRCTVYLTKNPRCTLFFDLLFSGVLLLSPFLSEGLLLAFCDLVISLMTILNLSALFLHRKEIKHGS